MGSVFQKKPQRYPEWDSLLAGFHYRANYQEFAIAPKEERECVLAVPIVVKADLHAQITGVPFAFTAPEKGMRLIQARLDVEHNASVYAHVCAVRVNNADALHTCAAQRIEGVLRFEVTGEILLKTGDIVSLHLRAWNASAEETTTLGIRSAEISGLKFPSMKKFFNNFFL